MATNDEWSFAEKEAMIRMCKESPALRFPLKQRTTADGTSEMVYDIPAKHKRYWLNRLWPFVGFDYDTPKYDLHSKSAFKASDMLVIRYKNRNLVVCPDYLNTGGMAVDVLEASEKDGDLPVAVRAVKR